MKTPNIQSLQIAAKLRFLAVWFYAIACVAFVSAQATGPAINAGTGMISGRVSNSATGAFLEGALIELPGLERMAFTDATGYFSISGVPAGAHELQVSYPGLDVVRKSLVISAGGRETLNVELGSAVYQLETLTVVGEREGNTASLAQQRNSNSIVNVVAVDAYGSVADGNIGNFLQRLPGIAALKGDGEIGSITMRGAPPNMSMVSLDGTRLAAAVNGGNNDRAANIGRIPAELIKQIEVYKALTPDLDADGIGGSANLVTRSAFDFKQRYINYRAAYSLNTYRDGNPWTPYYTLTAMDTFGPDKKLGISFSGSYNKTINPRDRVQMQHLEEDARNTTARFLDDKIHRIRHGYGLKFEYRFDPTASVYFNTLYTKSKSGTRRYNFQTVATSARRVADYSRVSRERIEMGVAPRTTANLTAGVAPGYTDTFTELLNASFINQPAFFDGTSEQFNFDLGGRKRWGELELTGKVTFSPAKTDNLGQVASLTMSGFGMAIDTSAGADDPTFTQTYGSSIYAGSDMAGYKMTYQLQPSRAEEEVGTVQLDLKRDFAQAKFPVQLKAGVKFRQQHRVSVSTNPRWNYVGPDGIAGRNSATGGNDDNLAQFIDGTSYALFNGKYPAFDRVNVDGISAIFAGHPEYFTPSGAVNDLRDVPPSEVTENVFAGYVMGKVELGRKVTIVTGLRGEATDVDATGTFQSNTAAGFTTTSKSGSYDKLFPSAHLRYEPFRNFQVRAAYTTAMARPSISAITPTTTVTTSATSGLGTINQGNPNLRPQYSDNYDLMFEYYLQPVGVLSAGLFKKDIVDFLATFRRDVEAGPDNGFDGDYEGYTLITTTNLGTAAIEGYELNYYQQLARLPKPFDGLSIFANYTHIKTEGSYDGGATDLANFVPETANAGVSWRHKRFDVRVNYNYKSPYLLTYSPVLAQTVRQTTDETWDLNLSYNIKRSWLTVYMDVINVFNKAPVGYSINTSRTDIVETFGTRLTVGVTGRF